MFAMILSVLYEIEFQEYQWYSTCTLDSSLLASRSTTYEKATQIDWRNGAQNSIPRKASQGLKYRATGWTPFWINQLITLVPQKRLE